MPRRVDVMSAWPTVALAWPCRPLAFILYRIQNVAAECWVVRSAGQRVRWSESLYTYTVVRLPIHSSTDSAHSGCQLRAVPVTQHQLCASGWGEAA